MLTQYINAAMRHAHYETMENGRVFGSIAECPGLWAEAETLDACRQELRATLESWLMLKLRHDDAIPAIDGIDLNAASEHSFMRRDQLTMPLPKAQTDDDEI